jgi:integrase
LEIERDKMTISKRNNKYYCRFQINGERHNYLCKNCKTLNEARLYEAELIKKISDIQNGISEPDKITLKKLVEYFLNYSFLNKKSYKQDVYRSKIILDYFGHNRYINTIKAFDIEKFKGFLLSNICGETTANRYLENVSKMYNLAIENEWCNKNPVKKESKFKLKNYTVRYLTKTEEKRLLKAFDKLPNKERYIYLKEMVIVALNTGFRLGNIRNLKWSNINLEFRFIELLENKGNKHIKIYMNDTLFELFSNKKRESEYIWINPYTNKPYFKIYNTWNNVKKIADLENFRFHDLRHTVGTRLAKTGVAPTVIKEILAHSSIQTTMRYVHTASEDMKNAMEKL